MADIDEKLDAIEDELKDANRSPAAEPLSIQDWLAKSGRAPSSSPPPQAAGETDDENDDSPSAPSPVPPPAPGPIPSPVGANPIAGVVGGNVGALGGAPSADPQVKDYIASRLASQGDALKAVQAQAARNQGLANITEGLGQAVAGAARSNTFNPASYKNLHDQANQPVENVVAQQKNKLANLQEIGAENDTQRKSALDDPNSMQSVVARRLASQALSKYNEDPSIVEGMSAGDLKEFLEKPLDQMEARDSREAIKKLQTESNALTRRSLDQAKTDKQDQKTATDQDKSYQKLRHDLETFRGNSAVAGAATSVMNANRALDIVKGKDPNTLTIQDLQLLADEMGKVATGGVPTEHGTQSLMPNNLATKWAEMKNFALSKPTDAQAGEYIKHNMSYLNAMKDTSQAAVNTYRSNIAKGYKNLVKPEDYAEAQQDYGLNAPAQSAPGAAPAPAAGGVTPFSDPDKEKRYQEWKAKQ